MNTVQSKPVTIAIVGLGLLGASLGMALRGKGFHRTGWTRRESIRRWAVDCDVLDECDDSLESVLSKADLTVFALPLPEIERYVQEYAENFRPGTVVTDIGSCKSGVMKAAESLKRFGVYFVGSHPMAGTEKSGPESAFPTLYRNADVFVCPYDDSPEEAIALVEKLWHAVETRTSRISAASHDQLVAHTSHVLHILASALALSILDSPDEATKLERFRGCATGFRDTSRIASSSPVMWREIIENNRESVLIAMRNFDRQYENFRQMIERGDFDAFEKEFARGKLLRDSWVTYKNKEQE
ncbi:MAG: prephenate dehydrogenase [Victivallales bacterium]|jgi:prephenate dehydrogenase|nr:prephenate dehydrogenase [Victivallales bacterium]